MSSAAAAHLERVCILGLGAQHELKLPSCLLWVVIDHMHLAEAEGGSRVLCRWVGGAGGVEVQVGLIEVQVGLRAACSR